MLILTFLEPTKKCVFFSVCFCFRNVLFISADYSGFVKKKIHKVIHVWLNLKTSLLTLQMNTASSAQQNLRKNTAPSFILCLLKKEVTLSDPACLSVCLSHQSVLCMKLKQRAACSLPGLDTSCQQFVWTWGYRAEVGCPWPPAFLSLVWGSQRCQQQTVLLASSELVQAVIWKCTIRYLLALGAISIFISIGGSWNTYMHTVSFLDTKELTYKTERDSDLENDLMVACTHCYI